MANLRDIRTRIDSIQNMQQITNAMKMVAAAKLRKAQNRIIETRPYATKMREVVARLAESTSEQEGSVLLQKAENNNNILFIVIGSDGGLCGGFNNNLFKEVEKRIDADFASQKKNGTLSVAAIGRKATKYFGNRNYQIEMRFPGFFDEIAFGKTSQIMKGVISAFMNDKYDEVYLAYNEFKSVLSQNRLIEQVLPIDSSALVDEEETEQEAIDYIFEPGVEAILKELLPLHINMQLWKAVLESNAAEQGARMTAMDNATENAKDLEDDLRLEYNRARQSAITTEISEIISGAQALQES